MRELSTTNREARGRLVLPALLFLLALLVGLPTLRGGFLSGDDYHLVLNHVLVNHPSIGHAVKLLSIVHRDLYQPIPLLSFSLDFAVIRALGLSPAAEGPGAGAWMFHLTNVLIHAVNTTLVFFLIKRLAGRSVAAVVAATIFAIHPLAAEPVTWLSGRMLMLSTLFTVATVIAFARWDERPTVLRGIITIALALLAHTSKVSVALPVLIAIVPLAARRWPGKRWWAMWIAVALLSAGFAAFNTFTSREMFEGAADQMTASPILYVLLALGQYFCQYVVPVGLSPWYPPPDVIEWSDRSVILSAAIVAAVAIVALRVAWHNRIVIVGLLWFIAAVGPTLPIIPARLAVAADRYVYLPNIGLDWIMAVAVVGLFDVLRRRSAAARAGDNGTAELGAPGGHAWSAPQVLLTGSCVVVCAVLMPLTWHTQSFYRNSLARVERIIRTHPDYPGIYEAAAWVHYREARYKEAIDTAMEDLRRHPVEMACKVHQVVGMSLAQLGRFDEAVASLEQAIEADPAYGKCYSRLGQIKAMTGRLDEAIGHYVRAIEIMPEYAPALIALGNLYRTTGETELAVQTFERVLEINSYDVSANLALGEMDIEREHYAGAIERLERLLDWMPENTVARTNLGVALDARGQERAAIDAYATAIRRDPYAVVAIVNLANVHIRKNDLIEAQRVCEEALPQNAGELKLLIAYHDVVQRLGQPDRAVNAFERACRLAPTDPDLQAWTAYALIHTGRFAEAASLPESSASGQPDLVIPYLTQTLFALHRDDREAAIQHVNNLLAYDSSAAKGAMDRMLGDLEWFASTHPESPWPYLLSAKVLIRQNRGEFAELAVTEFLRLCPSEECRARAEALLR